MLSESIDSEDSLFESSEFDQMNSVSSVSLVADADVRSGVSRPLFGSAPQLLTGGIPCTVNGTAPISAQQEVQDFSHGGYDGGTEVGFDGTWN